MTRRYIIVGLAIAIVASALGSWPVMRDIDNFNAEYNSLVKQRYSVRDSFNSGKLSAPAAMEKLRNLGSDFARLSRSENYRIAKLFTHADRLIDFQETECSVMQSNISQGKRL